jgi:hypothetical protein
MLNNALGGKGQDLSGRGSLSRDDTGNELEMLVEFRWEGTLGGVGK